MMNRVIKSAQELYDTPSVQAIEICPEQPIASSCSLWDMEENEVYDEIF